jgi:hypothetical protein
VVRVCERRHRSRAQVIEERHCAVRGNWQRYR